jgi:hypothetical protein
MDLAGLTYPGEHTDVAAHLQASGWDTTRARLSDLFRSAGLPDLDEAEQQGLAAAVNFVRAVRT